MRPSIEARYRKEHVKEPVKLRTVEDADVHSLLRPLLPSGYHDHELMVGVDGSRQVGVLAFMDSGGNVVTLGSPEDYRYEEVAYCEMGHRREFPDNSEIPVALVRRAVKELLVSGGQRPECVQWQTPEFWLFCITRSLAQTPPPCLRERSRPLAWAAGGDVGRTRRRGSGANALASGTGWGRF
jgi:Immunity protein Imm1